MSIYWGEGGEDQGVGDGGMEAEVEDYADGEGEGEV